MVLTLCVKKLNTINYVFLKKSTFYFDISFFSHLYYFFLSSTLSLKY